MLEKQYQRQKIAYDEMEETLEWEKREKNALQIMMKEMREMWKQEKIHLEKTIQMMRQEWIETEDGEHDTKEGEKKASTHMDIEKEQNQQFVQDENAAINNNTTTTTTTTITTNNTGTHEKTITEAAVFSEEEISKRWAKKDANQKQRKSEAIHMARKWAEESAPRPTRIIHFDEEFVTKHEPAMASPTAQQHESMPTKMQLDTRIRALLPFLTDEERELGWSTHDVHALVRFLLRIGTEHVTDEECRNVRNCIPPSYQYHVIERLIAAGQDDVLQELFTQDELQLAQVERNQRLVRGDENIDMSETIMPTDDDILSTHDSPDYGRFQEQSPSHKQSHTVSKRRHTASAKSVTTQRSRLKSTTSPHSNSDISERNSIPSKSRHSMKNPSSSMLNSASARSLERRLAPTSSLSNLTINARKGNIDSITEEPQSDRSTTQVDAEDAMRRTDAQDGQGDKIDESNNTRILSAPDIGSKTQKRLNASHSDELLPFISHVESNALAFPKNDHARSNSRPHLSPRRQLLASSSSSSSIHNRQSDLLSHTPRHIDKANAVNFMTVFPPISSEQVRTTTDLQNHHPNIAFAADNNPSVNGEKFVSNVHHQQISDHHVVERFSLPFDDSVNKNSLNSFDNLKRTKITSMTVCPSPAAHRPLSAPAYRSNNGRLIVASTSNLGTYHLSVQAPAAQAYIGQQYNRPASLRSVDLYNAETSVLTRLKLPPADVNQSEREVVLESVAHELSRQNQLFAEQKAILLSQINGMDAQPPSQDSVDLMTNQRQDFLLSRVNEYLESFRRSREQPFDSHAHDSLTDPLAIMLNTSHAQKGSNRFETMLTELERQIQDHSADGDATVKLNGPSEILHRDTTSQKTMTASFITRWVREVFDAKTRADSQNRDNDRAVIPLPEFVLDQQRRIYGVAHLVVSKTRDIMHFIRKYSSFCKEVAIFNEFLEESRSLSDLILFLRSRAILYSLTVGLRWPGWHELRGSNDLDVDEYISLSRAEAAASAIFAKSGQLRQSLLDLLPPYCSTWDALPTPVPLNRLMRDATHIGDEDMKCLKSATFLMLVIQMFRQLELELKHNLWAELCFRQAVGSESGLMDFEAFQFIMTHSEPRYTDREIAQLYVNVTRASGLEKLTVDAFKRFCHQIMSDGVLLALSPHAQSLLRHDRRVRIVREHSVHFRRFCDSFDQHLLAGGIPADFECVSHTSALRDALESLFTVADSSPVSPLTAISLYRRLLHTMLCRPQIAADIAISAPALDEELTTLESVLIRRFALWTA